MSGFIPTCTGGIHHISTDSIRMLLLELINLINSMTHHYYFDDLLAEFKENTELGRRYSNLIEDSYEYRHNRMSEVLIEIAIKVRILHDFLSRIHEKECYMEYMNIFYNKQKKDWLLIYEKGAPDKKSPKIIQASNKIIHASEISGFYPDSNKKNSNDIFLIELRGMRHQTEEEWLVKINPIEMWITIDYMLDFLQKNHQN